MSESANKDGMRVLVTGADGFIGQHLIELLRTRGADVRGAVHRSGQGVPVPCCVVGDVGPQTDWNRCIEGVQVVIHLAARAHVLRETATDPRGEFMRVNAEGTDRLARSAVAAGVKRLIYVSSIGVHGLKSGAMPFNENSPLHPRTWYAESKLAGEVAARTSTAGAVELVVLRPPLVYGSGVKANFLNLLRWIDRGWPVPVGMGDCRRSLVSVWNLSDLVALLVNHPKAPQQPWLVSDGEDLTLTELVRRIARALHRRALPIPLPRSLLRAGGVLMRKTAAMSALCESLIVDSGAARRELGWQSPLSVDAGLARTTEWYRAERGRQA